MTLDEYAPAYEFVVMPPVTEYISWRDVPGKTRPRTNARFDHILTTERRAHKGSVVQWRHNGETVSRDTHKLGFIVIAYVVVIVVLRYVADGEWS